MSDTAARFAGDIPKFYDECLGPVLFEDYGADLARRTCASSPGSVLELACGTGIVSRVLRDQLGSEAHITATDLNPDMLTIAGQKFADEEAIDFQPVDATDLPHDDASFDAVMCQFGVMFFPDKGLGFREAQRVLKPGGIYHFNTWSSLDENPSMGCIQGVIEKIFPEDPPGFYKVPFSYANCGEISDELRDAGFSGVSYETVEFDKEVKDFDGFTNGLVYGNPLSIEIESRGGDPLEVLAAFRQSIADEFGSSPCRVPLKAHVFSATR
jgi:ubiquinone/menaquinone biosynthesis C-methylase UbiE